MVVTRIRNVLLVCLYAMTAVSAEDWITRRSVWHGFERIHFRCAGRDAYVVLPKEPAPGRPWVWRARFPDFHFEMDVELLRRGFHIGYVDVAGLFGSPDAMVIGDEFYRFMVTERTLAGKAVMEGVSRGGLFVYNRAVQRPGTVACIYCDTPVLDFKSWPGGLGNGLGSANAWQQCLKAYGFNESLARQYRGNPVDAAATVIAGHGIPVLHIVSENDEVVPPAENTYLLQNRLGNLGVTLPVISVPEGTAKSHGHHFTHPEPERVVEFIMAHDGVE